MTLTEQKAAAKAFAQAWKGRGDEKQETQKFWIELLHNVYGIASPTTVLEFEKKVKLEGSTKFIDVYIPDTKVIVEQKSIDIDLSKEVSQSGGECLTPYNQARRYDNNLPVAQKARWIVCCNFERFEIHNMNNPLAAPDVVYLKDLEKDFSKLQVIADIKVDSIRREEEISFKAGRLVGELYEMILPQYKAPDSAESLRSLNQLCVRLVFCLYAEDTGLFGEKDKFYKYLKEFTPGQFRKALIDLFKVFDTPYEDRDPYMDPELASFPYIKGGIFTDDIEIPLFTEEIKDKILNKASMGIDWSGISPTIFGAVFESTLNPETRRKGGMHYTSVENIHKVIDPLFLDELKKELNEILTIPVKSKRDRSLTEYQDKLASLKFLDPACGSGNFLTETYLSIRRLENKVLEALGVEGLLYLGDDFSPIKVKIDQFYGIEINDFAVSVARTALWIAEAQTLRETEHIVGKPIEYFPLKENPNIVEANALRIDWNDVIPASELNYIMGNPPFVGARMMAQGSEQKNDIETLFGNIQDVQDLDYVCGWYRKAAAMIQGTNIEVGFVSTNSIAQGSQVPILWNVLYKTFHIHINFAHRTFRWNSEATDKAAVHCVIIGFSTNEHKEKILFEYPDINGKPELKKDALTISPYLTYGKEAFVVAQKHPLCDVPEMRFGSQPRDGGHFILSTEERDDIISQEPFLDDVIKQYMGADEYIKGKVRYCIWLHNEPLSYILKSRILKERIAAVEKFRLSSNAATTRGYAKVPSIFAQIAHPYSEYLVIPRVSSENRPYIPVGFISKDIIASDAVTIVPNATLFHFGILTSSVHMAWMRAVCGRLEMRYRYSKEIVYNTFPWPNENKIIKAKIESAAKSLIEKRESLGMSYAEMYEPVMLKVSGLLSFHQALDKAVMEAYGFDKDMSESDIVAALFKMYQALTEK